MKPTRFRFYDKDLKKMFYRKPLFNDFSHPNIIPMQYVGFEDKRSQRIYEGDILSDKTMTDEGIVKSRCQVFWNQPTGSWHLDLSHKQDMTCSTELWLELNDFDYEVVGNVYDITE